MNTKQVSIIQLLAVVSLSLSFFNFKSSACTAYEMDTPDGPFYGCNLDLQFPGDGHVFVNKRGVEKTGMGESSTGARAKWVSKYGSITVNVAGREFPWGGINEAGLTFSTLLVVEGRLPDADTRAPLPEPMWAQCMLDTCATLEEVIELNERFRPVDTVSNHFLVSDAEGNCLAIEWLDGKMVYYVGDTLPAKAMSNMPYWQAAEALERGGKSKWRWLNPGRSSERFAAAHWRAATYNPEVHSDNYRYAFDTLTQFVAAGHTRWNVVFNINERLMLYRSKQSPEVKWVSLNDFDFAEGTDPDPLMLDVNADLEGDIKDKFHAYDPEMNKMAFNLLCARWGIDLPEGCAQDFVDHYATYTKVL